MYFRELEIDNLDIIKSKTLDYIKTCTSILNVKIMHTRFDLPNDEFFSCVPELKNAFDQYGISVAGAGFYLSFDSMTVTHIDVFHHKARINIPILNVDGTHTNFYSDCVIDPNPIPGHHYAIINTDYKLADKLETKKATVFRVSAPHRVVIPKNHSLPRIMLMLNFDKDPVFLLD